MKIMVLLLLLFFAACSFPKEIPPEAAEEIALKQVESDGHPLPSLWKEFSEETVKVYQFSIKENKDVKAWKVQIDTQDHMNSEYMPALIYFVNTETGEIIEKISGME